MIKIYKFYFNLLFQCNTVFDIFLIYFNIHVFFNF
jgi:hypothetical protein